VTIQFDPIDFESFNETDVREEVIAPLIKELGYRTGSENNIIREQSLRYPKKSLGRKDPKKDPLLRGKADYICVAGEKVRWVIEAKPPGVDIDRDCIEQAYSYANHPEVRAVYFCVCNGIELRIYQTNQGPDIPAIKCFRYDEWAGSLENIRNILGPDSLLRDFPEQIPDTGEPIGPGLRSVARITNGKIVYNSNTLNFAPLKGLTLGISEGSIERKEDGCLIAYLKTVSSHQWFQDYNEKHGLDSFEVISTDKALSTNKSSPTILVDERTIILPAGEEMLDMNTWAYYKLESNLTCTIKTTASGFLSGRKFEGEFDLEMSYIEVNLKVGVKGDFMIHLA